MMGMPITIEIIDAHATSAVFDELFDYFAHIDEVFSTYKPTSEVSALNAGSLALENASEELKMVFTLSEETKQSTAGFFDIKKPDGSYDPSGLVKGWAIWNAAQILQKKGFEHFYVDAGGDIQVHGSPAGGPSGMGGTKKWAIGIKNPWNEQENIKVVYVSTEGVATSGTYIRGEHIYNPKTGASAQSIASFTVIGPNIYEADRFATAVFAMGRDGIQFIETLVGFEGYMIDNNKIATMTTGFEHYTNETGETNKKQNA